MASRRDRFREYMAHLDPSDSAAAIARGLYVEWPGQSVAERIRLKVELQPTAAQIVVGGIGSGKTTQLLAARDAIENIGDTRALYVDFAKKYEIEALRAGALIVLVGLTLREQLGVVPAHHKALLRLKELAYGEPGYSVPVASRSFVMRDAEPTWITGLLSPSLANRVEEATRVTTEVLALLAPQRHVVVLVDSLDRVADTAAFEAVVRQDVPALAAIGIGVVLAAPLPLLFGARRALLDRFDAVHQQPALDVEPEGADLSFMCRMLRARADASMLPDGTCAELARLSGGVPRDLISLARAAGEEAYVAGAETVRSEHVAIAGDAFGRRLAFGLSAQDVATLKRIANTGRFVEASDREVMLLVTRRVLERGGSPDRVVVHPALVPLLQAVAA